MSDVLCLYYSRTGRTEEAMQEIAAALNAELVEITDDVDRSGLRGFLRAGREAMRSSTHPLEPYHTEKNLEDYRLVILGTPVWAGRCASPIRALLKRRGLEMARVAYVLTRSSDRKYSEVFQQMDMYTAEKHVLAVSLRPGNVGYNFWLDGFIQDVKRYLEQ
jgi:flavodoxin